jgi:hypothetical protein
VGEGGKEGRRKRWLRRSLRWRRRRTGRTRKQGCRISRSNAKPCFARIFSCRDVICALQVISPLSCPVCYLEFNPRRCSHCHCHCRAPCPTALDISLNPCFPSQPLSLCLLNDGWMDGPPCLNLFRIEPFRVRILVRGGLFSWLVDKVFLCWWWFGCCSASAGIVSVFHLPHLLCGAFE